MYRRSYSLNDIEGDGCDEDNDGDVNDHKKKL